MAEAPPSASDFLKPNPRALPGELPGEILRRNLRDLREARGLTQHQLAERMTVAGTQMRNVTISNIENGARKVSVDELVVFAVVLEKPIVRLLTPRPDDETLVRITNWRLFRPVELRNWIIYGDASTPAAKGAQLMARLAYDSLILLDDRENKERKDLARNELLDYWQRSSQADDRSR